PGRGWLAELELPAASREIITDCLAVIDGLAPLIDRIDGELHARAKADPRVKTLRTLPGVGEFTALVMVAEIGDISRFPGARKLASWAGLTPAVRGSDLKVRHGHIPRTGLRLAAVGHEPGRADRRGVPGLRRRLRGHRQAARQEDRHHRDRPQAADPRLAPAIGDAGRRGRHAAAAGRDDGRVARPRVSSLLRHEPAPRAALDHLTQQPGPRHMAIAAARTRAAPRRVLWHHPA